MQTASAARDRARGRRRRCTRSRARISSMSHACRRRRDARADRVKTCDDQPMRAGRRCALKHRENARAQCTDRFLLLICASTSFICTSSPRLSTERRPRRARARVCVRMRRGVFCTIMQREQAELSVASSGGGCKQQKSARARLAVGHVKSDGRCARARVRVVGVEARNTPPPSPPPLTTREARDRSPPPPRPLARPSRSLAIAQSPPPRTQQKTTISGQRARAGALGHNHDSRERDNDAAPQFNRLPQPPLRCFKSSRCSEANAANCDQQK